MMMMMMVMSFVEQLTHLPEIVDTLIYDRFLNQYHHIKLFRERLHVGRATVDIRTGIQPLGEELDLVHSCCLLTYLLTYLQSSMLFTFKMSLTMSTRTPHSCLKTKPKV